MNAPGQKPKTKSIRPKPLDKPDRPDPPIDSWDKWIKRITNPAFVNLLSLLLGTAGVVNELIFEDTPRPAAIPFIGFFLSTPLIRFGDTKIKEWRDNGDVE